MKKNYVIPECKVQLLRKIDIVLESTAGQWYDPENGEYGENWIWGEK